MKIWELETKNGRIFRVCVANNNQEKKLLEIVEKNKEKSYEIFTRVEPITNSVHSMKTFEHLAESLQ